MPIEIKMPALSPTMEEGTLAKWLVKEGDTVKSGDLMAEIETDKATMEFEAVDEGTIGKIMIAEGTDNVKVGTVIATLLEEGESADAAPTAETPAPAAPKAEAAEPATTGARAEQSAKAPESTPQPAPQPVAASSDGNRIKASPLARRIAAERSIDLSALTGSGPNGRIVKADLEGAKTGAAASPAQPAAAQAAPTAASAAVPPVAAAKPAAIPDIPHEATKLSNVRKTIARRLTESKQQVPHIYLTVDIRLDALLKLRGELNAALEPRGVKLSVNDLLIKALAVSLIEVPSCNVMFTPDQLISFQRADISVAVSAPSGLITPVITQGGHQDAEPDLDRDEGSRHAGTRPEAQAGGIYRRHCEHQQYGHVRDQEFRCGDQSAASDDHGDRRGREASVYRRWRTRRRDGDVGDRQLRSPRDRRVGWRTVDAGVQGTGREPAGHGRLRWGGGRSSSFCTSSSG